MCYRDWSSDVCSSDLLVGSALGSALGATEALGSGAAVAPSADPSADPTSAPVFTTPRPATARPATATPKPATQIGRASCRERAETSVVDASSMQYIRR